jgi:hypothetical protein
MQIIAQSQTPIKASYIHLAYISAALSARISKGDLYPTEAILGLALLGAVACATLKAWISHNFRKLIRTAILGFIGVVCVLVFAERVWSGSRSKEAIVEHIIQTRQWWAVRDPEFTAKIEAVALTNGQAAGMVADYYVSMGGWEVDKDPLFFFKSQFYGEIAVAKGGHTFAPVNPDEDWSGYASYLKTALDSGKLNETEKNWVMAKIEKGSKKN